MECLNVAYLEKVESLCPSQLFQDTVDAALEVLGAERDQQAAYVHSCTTCTHDESNSILSAFVPP